MGEPSAGGAFVTGGAGGSAPGSVSLGIGGGVRPMPVAWPSLGRLEAGISLGWTGACPGAAGSFIAAGAFISVRVVAVPASDSLLEQAAASAVAAKRNATSANL